MKVAENEADETKHSSVLSRRVFLVGAAAGLAGCVSSGTGSPGVNTNLFAGGFTSRMMYAPDLSEPYPVPGVDVRLVDPRYLRQEVAIPSHVPDRPNSIVVDPSNRFLYYVEEDGFATRYGVGVGREGFLWNGSAYVGRKAEWPTWTPPSAMMVRDPSLRQYAGGMDPGIMNPLGARALYLYRNGADTLYRLHGTNEPWSIGQAMSSGCIRMLNQDVINLYERAAVGTRVTVLGSRIPDALA